jgi:hypothetical protein
VTATKLSQVTTHFIKRPKHKALILLIKARNCSQAPATNKPTPLLQLVLLFSFLQPLHKRLKAFHESLSA